MYISLHIYEGCSKCSEPHPERRSTLNIFLLVTHCHFLTKLEKSEIVFLVLLEVVVCCHNENVQPYTYFCVRLKTFWTTIVFVNGPGDWGSIPGQVIPKTQKMVLDTSLLNTQQYKVCIKGKVEQPREKSGTLAYILV